MKDTIKLLFKNKIWFVILLVNWLFVSFSTGYTILALNRLNGIENELRIAAMVGLVFIWLLVLLFSVRRLLLLSSPKYKKIRYLIVNIIIIVISLLYAGGIYFISDNVGRVVNKIDEVTTTTTTYSSSLITLATNTVNTIEEIGNAELGILTDETSNEGFLMPYEVINELGLTNDVELYGNYIEALAALYSGEISYIFVPTNYSVLFASIEGYENIKTETKIIYTKTKEVESEMTVNTSGTLDKPFTILLMGVDSELESIKGASFNGDSLMLITFNPNTLSATILSIPRDTYTNISCFSGKRKNKITHAAWYGEKCMMRTIENMTDVKIDYFVKINFKGVVNLVNAVGGVEVDVPYAFCEQNSSRLWGDHTVFVEKGLQVLDGEKALAFARNRHTWPKICGPHYSNDTSNDFVRGQNQQTVVKALMNKLKDVRSLDTFYDVLDTVSNSMETNMSTNEILSLYNVAKKALSQNDTASVESIISMQRLYISGYSLTIHDYSQYDGSGMQMNLYNFVPYKGSLRDITHAMKVNLGLEASTVTKEFEFDVNKQYEEHVIGKGYYNENSIPLLNDFYGKSEAAAASYCENYGLKCVFNYFPATDASQYVGMIIKQNIAPRTDLDYVHTVTFDVINKAYVPEPPKPVDCTLEENKDNASCSVKSFVGSTIASTKKWFSKYDIQVTYKEVEESSDPDYSGKAGLVVKQSDVSGSLYDYIGTGKEFIITYVKEKEEVKEEPKEEVTTPEPKPDDQPPVSEKEDEEE